ncbi:19_t:CDS:1, partial [Diversispora eburnea]
RQNPFYAGPGWKKREPILPDTTNDAQLVTTVKRQQTYGESGYKREPILLDENKRNVIPM